MYSLPKMYKRVENRPKLHTIIKGKSLLFALEKQYNFGDIWNKIAAGKAIITLLRRTAALNLFCTNASDMTDCV